MGTHRYLFEISVFFVLWFFKYARMSSDREKRSFGFEEMPQFFLLIEK